ncbi:ArsB/NhaD family transporter [Clostridium sp. D2Q-14]|uniref:SLC13 family permease n=1 Tax=Anaeromonas gelatinilytica TaxID=2683194 RepID=UPI00193BC6BE|nr:ArsB/NhaD family transporter [Anaeromonas gelatinilytica]MBS4534870.1 ArsB/NhaD family transporter [Anaeromonas gelatinilytica]
MTLDYGVYIAVSIFIITYIFIISEKINRTAIALFGASLLIGLKVISQEYAFDAIDFNTIGLLIGMMIMVSIIKKTGIFQYVAIKAAKKTKGDPFKIILTLFLITAISSALLDNVTTVLLIVPVTLVITETLKTNPLPFLIPEILASNIGGTATLIGDPPNIMIGSATNLGFMDFALNLGPIVIIILGTTLIIFKFLYGKSITVDQNLKDKLMTFDESKSIKDYSLLKKSLFVLGLTMIGFILHQYIHLESATVALIGASLLLIISKKDPEDILLEVEWSTIFFFAGLFVLVGGLEKVGIIEHLASGVLDLTKGDLMLTTLMILWVSALASAFIDNIPFVATMIPLIKSIGAMSAISIGPLWWALALGACLGGNGSLVGASANVIVAGFLQKTDNKLSFINFLKIGFPIMILSVILSSVYLVLFYI